MSSKTDELVRELRRLRPDSPILRHFDPPVSSNVRPITREDRERAAFRRLTDAIGALMQRNKLDDANDALRRYVKRGECDE